MSWTFTDGNNTIATADIITEPVPDLTRGTEQTLTAVFESTTDYEAILDFLEYEGGEAVRRGTTDRGVPWFRERVPSDAPVSSYVVGLDSSTESRYDVWTLIVSGTDNSTAGLGHYQVDVTVFVLASLSDYATRSDVINALADER